MPDFSDDMIRNAFLAGGAIAIACAVLSVFVVARRWAFMGEGISHSGFGGAGTAWMILLFFPHMDSQLITYAFVIIGCLGTAIAIGALTNGSRVTSDAAIGIFLVASLAWGFIGQQLWVQEYHSMPTGFDGLLFGQMKAVSNMYVLAAGVISFAVLACIFLLGKEIVAYCLDPQLAQTSGVRTTLIHYTLLILMAITIIIGVRVVGSVLMTAMLVLPAATANLLSKKLTPVIVISIIVALLGTWGGLWINTLPGKMRGLPSGSLIVLGMFVQFMLALVVSKVRNV